MSTILCRTSDIEAVQSIGSAQQLLALLVGDWNFCRTITGYPAMEGIAQFLRDDRDGSVRYREELQFPAPNGTLLSGHREYLYRASNDGIALEILFVRGGVVGALFLTLPISDQVSFSRLNSDYSTSDSSTSDSSKKDAIELTGNHLCINDLYQAHLKIESPDLFSIQYTITGPQKNHVHSTRYRRHQT